MTGWTVEFTSSAAKQIRKLEPGARRRVTSALLALGVDPRGAGTKKLVGTDHGWRLRIGDYRVLYEIYDGEVLVVVFQVSHRREAYRDR